MSRTYFVSRRGREAEKIDRKKGERRERKIGKVR